MIGLPTKLYMSDFKRNRYLQVAEPGTTLDDMMAAGYWTHVHNTLQVNDIIECVAADGSFDADIRLTRKGPGFLQWRVIREWRPEATAAVSTQYEAVWSGPQTKWAVRDVSSNERVVTGLASKAEAQEEVARRSNAKPEAA